MILVHFHTIHYVLHANVFVYCTLYMCVEHAASNVTEAKRTATERLKILFQLRVVQFTGIHAFPFRLPLSLFLHLSRKLLISRIYEWIYLCQFILVDAIMSRCLAKLQTILWAWTLPWIVHITHGIMKNWCNIKITWPTVLRYASAKVLLQIRQC